MAKREAGTSKYEVLRQIARGGMGEVFLARQLGIEGFAKEVVIKRIHQSYAGDPEFVKMFLEEARIAALLDHPNIVQIFELGRDRSNYFIVMEYVEGLSLSRMLKAAGGPLPLPVALQIASGVAEGLQFAHAKRDPAGEPLNLVHRDVSPPNILLSTAGSVKLTDFGIAKVRWSVTQTQVGTVKGKYYYISPEQARGEPADRRADVYSLGLVLYEMTTGRRAYASDNDTEVLRAAANATYAPPGAIIPEYPRDLERVVLRALAKEREARYADCQELQEELLALLVGRNLVLSPSRLGQFVQQMLQEEIRARLRAAEAVKTQPDPSPVGELATEEIAELQTIILDRVEDTSVTEPRTVPEEVDHGAATQILTGVPADDELTQLDTRLPPLMPDDVPTAVKEGQGSVTGAVGELRRRRWSPLRPLHVVLLAGIALSAAGVVWVISAPTPDPPRALAPPADEGRERGREHGARPPASVAADAAVVSRTVEVDASAGRRADPPRDARPPRPVVRRRREPPVVRPRPRPERPAEPAGPQVVLKVSTDPPADVYHGRRRLGRTPLEAQLPRKPLSLVFKNPEQGLDVTRRLSPDAARMAVRFVFRKGKISFALPDGCLVRLDGKLLGRTPRPPVEVYEGRHTVLVIGPGDKRRRLRIPVEADRVTKVRGGGG